MSVIRKDLGMVTAYAYAVSKGYTGTEEQFATLMASYADVGQTAVDAALAAKASEDAAKASETASAASQAAAATSAWNAQTAAGNASQAAQTATTKASEAAQSATQAAGSATTASTKAGEAAQSATQAAGSATAAESAKTAAQAAQTAAETAQTAAETAQGAAEDAAESVSASAAQIAQNTADISSVKSAFSNLISGEDTIASMTFYPKWLNSSNVWTDDQSRRATDYLTMDDITSVTLVKSGLTAYALRINKDKSSVIGTMQLVYNQTWTPIDTSAFYVIEIASTDTDALLFKKNLVEQISKKNETYVIPDVNTSFYFETQTRDVYMSFDSPVYLRGKYDANFATIDSFGLSLVTSPEGHANCIQIPHNNVLVYDTTTFSCKLVNIASLTSTDLPLFSVSMGEVIGGCGLYIYDKTNRTNIDNKLTKIVKQIKTFVIPSKTATFYFETQSNNVYMSFTSALYIRGRYSSQATIDSFGLSLVTSPEGHANCIQIPHNNVLVYDIQSNTFSMVAVNELQDFQIPLFYASMGTIAGGLGQYIYDRYYSGYIAQNKALPQYWTSYIDGKTNDIKELAETCEDTFFFVTDIHVPDNQLRSPDIIRYIQGKIGIEKVYNNGDYMDANSTRRAALDVIDAWVTKTEPGWYVIRGNHDTNYQGTGTVTEQDFSGHTTKRLQNIVTLMEENRNIYYIDNEQAKIRYIFLDTISEGTLDISDQVNWMKARITELSSGWGVIVITHMYFAPSPVSAGQTTLRVLNVGAQIKAGLDAVYDTASAKIIAYICGHCHRDYSITTEKGYPIISTTCDAGGAKASYWDINYPTRTVGTTNEQAFDIYGIDKTNKKITALRIGAGAAMREFTYA